MFKQTLGWGEGLGLEDWRHRDWNEVEFRIREF